MSACRHVESHWIDQDEHDAPLWRCDDCGEVSASQWPMVWCETCGGPEFVVEESDEQIGVEEQAREVHVTRLDCGHVLERPIRRPLGGLS